MLLRAVLIVRCAILPSAILPSAILRCAILRCALAVVAGLLAGCANNPPISTGFAPPAQATEVDRDPSKKTLASKVLSAIALERVTGRKPDPARLTELN